jgi:O-antigen/teichoic acid export membrane protein/O-antigen ligase
VTQNVSSDGLRVPAPVWLTYLLQGALALVVTAAALVSGLAVGGGDKTLVVLPLAAVGGLVLAVFALTRFTGFILLLLGARSSLDALQLSGPSAGTTTGNTVVSHGLDPSSLVGVLFLLAAMLWLAGRYSSGMNIKASRAALWLMAFWLAGVVSILASQHPQASALESLRIMSVAMMFVVLEQIITSREMMVRVLVAAYVSLLIPLGYTLFGLLSGHPASEEKSGFVRLIGTFIQSNDYARYLAFMIVFGVAIYPRLQGRLKAAMAALLIVSGVVLVLTLTLGAIIGTAIGILLVAVLQRRRSLVVGFVVTVVLVSLASPALASRFSSVSSSAPSAIGQPSGNSLAWRLSYWSQVLPLANSNPVTGIGLNSTQYETSNAKQPHNDFLRAYVETGVVGLVIYIAMLGALIGTCRRAVRRAARGTLENAVGVGALACCVCFLLESLAANVITNVVDLWYLVAFVAAAGFVARSGGNSQLAGIPAPAEARPAPAEHAGLAGSFAGPRSEPTPSGPDVSPSRRGVARGSGLNLVGAICSQSALFLILAVLALRLGKADVGRYVECYAMLSLLGLLSLSGFRAALTRFVAVHLADRDPGRLRGTVRLGLSLTLAGSTTIGLVLVLASAQIAGLFHDPSLRSGIILVALTLPASTFEDMALAATQGWRSQKAFALIGWIFDPMSRLLLTTVVVLLGGGLTGALCALVASSWSGAILAGLALRRRMDTVPVAAAVVEFRQIFNFSLISWVSSLATTGLIWADTLLLGNLSTQENVGTYSIATRLVTLAVFVMAPIQAAFSPHIAHLWHVGDRPGIARTFGTANRWIMWLSTPAFILLLVFPRDLLQFFGHGFATGATVTAILAIGQMMSAAAGPCGTLLNMSGRVALSMIDNVAVLVGNIALNLLLIPRYGIVGAAVAWSVSLGAVNLVKFLQVRYVLGIRSVGSSWGKTLLAAIPAAAVAMSIAWLTDGWLAAALIGGPCVIATFAVAMILLGVDSEDAAMARSVLATTGRRLRLSAAR